jgi:hypothetical protein
MTLELLKMWSLTGQTVPLGMPTHQLERIIPYDYIGAIDDAYDFLPAQLIIYFITLGFYGLLLF